MILLISTFIHLFLFYFSDLNEMHNTLYTSTESSPKLDVRNLHLKRYITENGYQLLKMNLTKLKVYMYDLPKEFNELAEICASTSNSWSMCFNFSNGGFGKQYWSRDGVNCHGTHQFSLEKIMHHRLLRSSFITTNKTEAHFFYVPYYASLNCFCTPQNTHLNSAMWNIVLREQQYTKQLKPHLMALGKVEQVIISLHVIICIPWKYYYSISYHIIYIIIINYMFYCE